MLVKEMLFEDFSHNILTLSLNPKFKNLLTKTVQYTIQTALQSHFSQLCLKINLAEIASLTLGQKEKQAEAQKIHKIQQQFLADPAVLALQKIFSAPVDVQSIKTISAEKTH